MNRAQKNAARKELLNKIMSAASDKYLSELESRYLPRVQAYLSDAVGTQTEISPLLRYHMGWTNLKGVAEAGPAGKSLRPILCLVACEMAGGEWSTAIPAAAALELIHNFSLIHDDIQDGDFTRRSRPTLWSEWGVAKAVNAGNTMRVIADKAMLELKQGEGDSGTAIKAALEGTLRCLDMIEGQYMDMSFEGSTRVSVANYLDMVGRKTGALIESAMYIGALIATGNKQTASEFGKCGRNLGVAFQIRDDYLGVWGNPQNTGKPVGSDIKRKKKSLPTVYMFNQASKNDLKWLETAYSQKDLNESQVRKVLEIMNSLDGAEYVQYQANIQAEKTKLKIDKLKVSKESKSQLSEINEYFVNRKK